MTISELIAALENIRAEHGDVEVVTGDEWDRTPEPQFCHGCTYDGEEINICEL